MKKLSITFLEKWTESAIECYLRRSKCKGCLYAATLESNCQMYATVKRLESILGPPMIIDAPQVINIERETSMLLDHPNRGFILSYEAWPEKLVVYKNRKQVDVKMGVIIDNTQRVKERFGKESIVTLYNALTPGDKLDYKEVINMYDKNELAQMFWDLCVDESLPKKSKENKSNKKTQSTDNGERVVSMKEYQLLMLDKQLIEATKLPRQAKNLAFLIIDNFKNTLDERFIYEYEIIDAAEKSKKDSQEYINNLQCNGMEAKSAKKCAEDDGFIVTKQDGERIFKYYRGDLKKHGVINFK